MDYAVLSKVGDREINEDYIDVFSAPAGTVFVLADGLGGHGGGEIASKTAGDTIKKVFLNDDEKNTAILLEKAFISAHDILKKLQHETQEANFFKTTLIILLVNNNEFMWGYIGDSRIYHFEQDVLIERSMDHSVTQMLVNSGKLKEKRIRHHEDRNRLTKVLGAEDDNSKPYISVKEPRTRDAVFLLCSDGFWELIDEKKMIKLLRKSSDMMQWLNEMETIVIKNGKKKNMDNYSAIAIKL